MTEGVLGGEGEGNIEGGTLAGGAVYIDGTAQPLDKVASPEETKAHASGFFGAPAHLKNMGHMGWENTKAAIANGDL